MMYVHAVRMLNPGFIERYGWCRERVFAVAQQTEESKVDQMYDILAKKREPQDFYELVDQVFEKGEIEADGGEKLARLYTTLSLDGRFLSIGGNLWSLRTWFPFDQREDDVAKTLGKDDAQNNRGKVDEDGFDDYEEIDDEEIDEDDLEDFDDDTDEDFDDADEDGAVQHYKRKIERDDEEE